MTADVSTRPSPRTPARNRGGHPRRPRRAGNRHRGGRQASFPSMSADLAAMAGHGGHDGAIAPNTHQRGHHGGPKSGKIAGVTGNHRPLQQNVVLQRLDGARKRATTTSGPRLNQRSFCYRSEVTEWPGSWEGSHAGRNLPGLLTPSRSTRPGATTRTGEHERYYPRWVTGTVLNPYTTHTRGATTMKPHDNRTSRIWPRPEETADPREPIAGRWVTTLPVFLNADNDAPASPRLTQRSA